MRTYRQFDNIVSLKKDKLEKEEEIQEIEDKIKYNKRCLARAKKELRGINKDIAYELK